MFTDIVGYTRIVGEDEARARRTRAALRSLLSEALATWGGTLIQSFGDGTLSVFPTAVGSALAAGDVQVGFARETGCDLRIGLHLGEVAWDEEGVYGDAVNLAARLQGIATPGSVLMSKEVARQLKSQPDMRVVDVGAVRVKNVEGLVQVFALAMPELRLPRLADVAQRAREAGGAGATQMPPQLLRPTAQGAGGGWPPIASIPASVSGTATSGVTTGTGGADEVPLGEGDASIRPPSGGDTTIPISESSSSPWAQA
jgi:hypothetical protein